MDARIPGAGKIAADQHRFKVSHILLRNAQRLSEDFVRGAETEPLMRRALEIDEASYEPSHHNVARDLNNLAKLLQATNRLEKPEPLMRRHVEIFIAFAQQGFQHPHLEAAFVNYYSLLQNLGLPEAEIGTKLQSLVPPPSNP